MLTYAWGTGSPEDWRSERAAELMQGWMLRLSKNTESRVREILLDMRESERWKRYLLIADPSTEHDEIGWTTSVAIWATDEIPGIFSGTAMELTVAALDAAYALIDGEAR